MFTEADYEQYFTDLQKIERAVLFGVDNIISKITDRQIIDVLRQIRSDQVVHLELVGELLSIVRRGAVGVRR